MLVIWNPRAGRRGAAMLRRTLDALRARGYRPDLAETKHPRHATILARDAARRPDALIVAAGGDGTIAETVDGLRGSPARLGIIPIGTANVFAHELRLPFHPDGIADALLSGQGHAVWPGLLETGDQATGGQARLFLQMAGAGFDAHVVHRLSLGLKRWVGRTAYVWQTAAEIMRYHHAPLQLRLDGQPHAAASVIISKGRLYAGRYVLAPEARPTLPGFQVVMFTRAGALGTLGYAAALPLGLLPRARGIRTVQASVIEVTSAAAIPVQADGDIAGWLPLRVSDASHPITVVGYRPGLVPDLALGLDDDP